MRESKVFDFRRMRKERDRGCKIKKKSERTSIEVSLESFKITGKSSSCKKFLSFALKHIKQPYRLHQILAACFFIHFPLFKMTTV